MCQTCHGSGVFMRPVATVESVVQVTHRDGDYYWYEDVTVQTKIGGEDACPTCTARAEIEYQTQRKG